ncbi:unnamed protein product [Notodromas monacha]|uniref:SSD domain-containing protein n=1 Tax=Notodromas monacha TaxID=399045 RepID=A0A7R9BSA1_9CRUS|nr:unnamed protein product [Notodromas monacha]CAG0920761.1 unnamed protein product [Notodromas monacha]
MGCESDYLDRKLSEMFRRLGGFVAQHPSHFIIVPVLLAGLMSTGFQRLNHVSDMEYLFAPANSPSHQDRDVFRAFFPVDTNGRFQPDRLTDPTRFGQVLVFAKDGGSIFREREFAEAVELDALVRNISVDFFGEIRNYDTLCALWRQDCFSNDVLKLRDVVGDVESGAVNLTWPFFFHPDTFDTIIFPGFVGTPVLADEESLMVSSPAINLYYFAAMDSAISRKRADLWEDKFRAEMPKIKEKLKFVDVYWYSSLTNDTELVSTILVVIPYFAITVIVMIAFSVVTSMMRDWVQSKPVLGVVGVASACMATAAAFGLIMYLGVEFTGLVMASPFLMLGIGMDNTFVMLAGWRKTSIQDSVPTRLSHTYAEAAVSITITSLTNCLSFLIGIYTPFRAVQVFCMYTALAVFMIYLYHITFFGAWLALTGYWEEENRHCITLKKVLPLTEAGDMSRSYQLFCAGGVSTMDKHDMTNHALMSFFKNQMAKFLCIPAIKALIIMIFLAYLAVGGWGITQLNEGLQAKRLSMDGSYYIDYFDKSSEYFHGFPFRVMRGIPQGKNLWGNITINEDGTEIVASRFVVQVINLPDLNQVQKPMLALREIAKKYPQFHIVSYHPQYVFAENFVLVRGTTLQTVTLAAVLMLVVALIMIPAPMCAIWVGFSIISIEVGILGYMTFWEVSLDTISMICLIMCIGFSVDFSAHISYSFMSSDGATAEQKIADALEKVGLPIVQGSVSSIFGVIVLGFIPAYIYRTFFKTVFMVMLFGALHGLLLLPVLLTIFGNLFESNKRKPSTAAASAGTPEVFVPALWNPGKPGQHQLPHHLHQFPRVSLTSYNSNQGLAGPHLDEFGEWRSARRIHQHVQKQQEELRKQQAGGKRFGNKNKAALQHSPSTSESSLAAPRRVSAVSAASTASVVTPGLGKYLADRRRESALTHESVSYVRDPYDSYY